MRLQRNWIFQIFRRIFFNKFSTRKKNLAKSLVLSTFFTIDGQLLKSVKNLVFQLDFTKNSIC
jgi:hypothetical protein